MLRVSLKAQDGRGEDYWWVTCGACDTAWKGSREEDQIPVWRERGPAR
jgi:hypothetical protein